MSFEGYSERARQVVFLARYKAGEFGSHLVDVGHVLLALIYEDKGAAWAAFVADFRGAHVPAKFSGMPHAPFFSPEVADELLGEIDSSISRNKPAVPTETGIPLSAATKEVLQSALELMDATGREYVEPLHILGAILGQKELSPGAQIVQRAGITKEQAMAKLAEGND